MYSHIRSLLVFLASNLPMAMVFDFLHCYCHHIVSQTLEGLIVVHFPSGTPVVFLACIHSYCNKTIFIITGFLRSLKKSYF